MRLTAAAPAKVNLCLYLGGVRADGRHELVTVFESVSLCDRLSLTASGSPGDAVICPGVEAPNLVSAALDELRGAGWSGPPVTLTIDKRIPVAAGMGGGSADAAAALRLARAVQPVDEETLMGLRPDIRKLETLLYRGVIVTSRSADPEYDFASRFFAPRVGVDEDPVCGSAHCCLGPYWGEKLGKSELTGHQRSCRGGVVGVRVEGPRVILIGRAVTVLRGELV